MQKCIDPARSPDSDLVSNQGEEENMTWNGAKTSRKYNSRNRISHTITVVEREEHRKPYRCDERKQEDPWQGLELEWYTRRIPYVRVLTVTLTSYEADDDFDHPYVSLSSQQLVHALNSMIHSTTGSALDAQIEAEVTYPNDCPMDMPSL